MHAAFSHTASCVHLIPAEPRFQPVAMAALPVTVWKSIFDLSLQCNDASLRLKLLHIALFKVISALKGPKILLQLALKECCNTASTAEVAGPGPLTETAPVWVNTIARTLVQKFGEKNADETAPVY